MEKTLQDLEAGDLAYVSSRYGYSILEIKRITKTQIITTNGSKYRRRDGGLIGGGQYYYEYIQILTAEKKDKVKILRLKMRAKKMIDNIEIPIDTESLKKLIIAIKPFVPEETKWKYINFIKMTDLSLSMW